MSYISLQIIEISEVYSLKNIKHIFVNIFSRTKGERQYHKL